MAVVIKPFPLESAIPSTRDLAFQAPIFPVLKLASLLLLLDI